MKKINRIVFSGLSLVSLLCLSGCVRMDSNGQPYGLVWNLLGSPMAKVILFFANNQGLGFGIAIILVTIIVRLIILPLGLYQSWKATYQAEKMRFLQPVFGPAQERMKQAKTQEEKLQAQQDYFALQKEYGVSMFGGMGCLPIFLQMPFFSALFYAARYTNGIADSSFFGINLGERSLILVALAGVLYFIQSLVMQQGVDESQRQQMKSMMLMNPLMIVVFSWSSPASVTLYWVIGGVFGIVQQLLTTFLLKPILRKRIDIEFEQNPPRVHSQVKDVTPVVSETLSDKQSTKTKRNAGKQRSR